MLLFKLCFFVGGVCLEGWHALQLAYSYFIRPLAF